LLLLLLLLLLGGRTLKAAVVDLPTSCSHLNNAFDIPPTL
jgi:hypothetical protein